MYVKKFYYKYQDEREREFFYEVQICICIVLLYKICEVKERICRYNDMFCNDDGFDLFVICK